MKISEEDAQRRVNAENNLANLATPTHVTLGRRGSGKRGRDIPEFLRDTISSLSNQPDVKSKDVASAFEVSDAEVSFCKSGRIGGHEPTEERRAKVDERLEKIKDTALLKLMASLNLIDDDRLEKCSAKELSGVALNMSRIVKEHTPQETNTGPAVQVVIYAPETKTERAYKVVDV
jgi:hypothetical protein